MPAAPPNYYVPLIFITLIGWRVYRRIRRTIGRQPLRKKRLISGIVIYGILSALFSLAGILYPKVLLGLGGGLLLGVPLALIALHFTKFEATPQGRFYKTHPYIGVSIVALLVVRIFYRMIVLIGKQTQAQPNPAAMQSPLTFAIFGLLAGYYIAFYSGILVQSGKLQQPEPAQNPQPPTAP
jgi:hypothetical protein